MYAKVSPKPGEGGGLVSPAPAALRGDAPWALSALPECWTQISDTTGPRGFVLAHLPQGAALVRPPATIRERNCTISLAGGEAMVRRGEDRFRIPPPAEIYRAGDLLALLRGPEHGGYDLRVYRPAQPQP